MIAPDHERTNHAPALACGFVIPLVILGGVIGLGVAAFRLLVLVGPLGAQVQQAVPLHLAVRLATGRTDRVQHAREECP